MRLDPLRGVPNGSGIDRGSHADMVRDRRVDQRRCATAAATDFIAAVRRGAGQLRRWNASLESGGDAAERLADRRVLRFEDGKMMRFDGVVAADVADCHFETAQFDQQIVAQEHGIDGQRSYVGKHGTPPGNYN
jgi:hypothetical protein